MSSSRRQFLGRAGLGIGGLVVGAAAGGTIGTVVATSDDEVRANERQRAQAQFMEAGGAADEGESVARLGTHRVVWNTTVTSPIACISFDDGPTPEFTPRILEALAAAGVTATFNVMGYNAVQHPDLLREVLAAGHEIGNHTWTHKDLTTLTAAQTRDELVRCRDEVAALVDQPFTSFRPPRGEITGYALRVAAELGYDTYIWSVTRGPGTRRRCPRSATTWARRSSPATCWACTTASGRAPSTPARPSRRPSRSAASWRSRRCPRRCSRSPTAGSP